MTRLETFGWRHPLEPGIARIVSAHGDYYHLVCNEAEGEILARKKKSAFRDAPLVPMTGDFVRFRYNPQGESMLTEVLPRFSHFERKDPTAHRQSQTLAVNFDTLFIMMSLNENFSLPRLERFRALAADVGEARVRIVLTKSDLVDEPTLAKILALEPLASLNPPPIVISARPSTPYSLLPIPYSLLPYFAPGQTVAFIGSSGVGKSTLLNTLAGENWAATQEIQAWSGKGRHTTTSRELVMLPSGAMVIDTPGIREIGLLGEKEATLAKGEASHRYRLHEAERA